jgi:hypothetical protein
MSNNNTRGNTRNTGNSSQQNQNRGPKFVWVVRPSFTLGDCRVYFTKEDAIQDFGLPENTWTRVYDVKSGQNLDIWMNEKSPTWDAEFEVQWELEKIEIRPFGQAQTPSPAPITVPETKTPATKETPNTDSDEN